jgi:hypothetical protein
MSTQATRPAKPIDRRPSPSVETAMTGSALSTGSSVFLERTREEWVHEPLL